VSVVVPVRDNAAGLAALLARLDAQTLPRAHFEVVVGDDGSAEPPAIADGRARVVTGPPQTSYAARNRAVESARADVLAFCDSDCLPDPGWLEEGLAALDAADLAAGRVAFSAPPRPTPWSLLAMEFWLDQARNVPLGQAVTCNLFVRRSVFDRLGGFDASLPSGGDYDLTRRATASGARLVYAPSAVVWHPTVDSRREFLRKLRVTNTNAAIRRTRTERRLDRGAVAMLVPVAGQALARSGAGKPLARLDPERVAVDGRRPRRTTELRALAILYLWTGLVAGTARLVGWRIGLAQGRRP
jgi:GT2 family glycosyltransferase